MVRHVPGGNVSYAEFVERKTHLSGEHGFEPNWMPEFLFPFQRDIVEWATRKGRAAIFADCGLGKTPMQLVWAANVAEHRGKPVLIAAPLAVSQQVIREADKFGIEVMRSQDGTIPARIVVTNYERLSAFDPREFAGLVCDESSILKNFDGVRRAEVTEFMRKLPYRLLCTATASPNDYTELGTQSEAIGELGHMDMLNRFFRNQNNTSDTKGRYRGFSAPRAWEGKQWRFKGHAEEPFWQWVASWARALRRPSDLGHPDDGFVLPPIAEREHIVTARETRPDRLFDLPAVGFHEEREERRRTISERCEQVAELVNHNQQALVWCHLNPEGDLLEKLIPDAVQVAGAHTDGQKEERLVAFANGDIRVLVTKPKIGAWGLNLQNCAHVTFFPSHSYEQYYQGVRRCWRFGQQRPVTVDIVTTEGELGVKENLQRKAAQADRMFSALVAHMNDALAIPASNGNQLKEDIPAWLSPTNT
jgi:hypothetical protein